MAASEAYKGLDECRKTSLLQLAEDQEVLRQ